MDHLVLSAEGIGPTLGVQSPSEESRGLFLSRFDARNFAAPKPARGFGVQLYQFPGPGDQSHFVAASFSEMLPRQQNRVMLDPLVKDAWGIPALRIECAHSDAEFARVREQSVALSELIKLFAVRSIRVDEAPAAPGSANHECGTARMGTDPINSVLDPNNQCWEAKGLYVTDGASFPSQGHQNPTLRSSHSPRARAITPCETSTGKSVAGDPQQTINIVARQANASRRRLSPIDRCQYRDVGASLRSAWAAS